MSAHTRLDDRGTALIARVCDSLKTPLQISGAPVELATTISAELGLHCPELSDERRDYLAANIALRLRRDHGDDAA